MIPTTCTTNSTVFNLSILTILNSESCYIFPTNVNMQFPSHKAFNLDYNQLIPRPAAQRLRTRLMKFHRLIALEDCSNLDRHGGQDSKGCAPFKWYSRVAIERQRSLNVQGTSSHPYPDSGRSSEGWNEPVLLTSESTTDRTPNDQTRSSGLQLLSTFVHFFISIVVSDLQVHFDLLYF